LGGLCNVSGYVRAGLDCCLMGWDWNCLLLAVAVISYFFSMSYFFYPCFALLSAIQLIWFNSQSCEGTIFQKIGETPVTSFEDAEIVLPSSTESSSYHAAGESTVL
jgi:hypothetical protein